MKKYTISTALTCLVVFTSTSVWAQKNTTPQAKKATATATTNPLKNSTDSLSYAIGLDIAKNLKTQGINTINTNLLKLAMDQVAGGQTTYIKPEMAMNTIQEKLQAFMKQKADVNEKAGKAFLAANAKKAGVVSLPNGLQYVVVNPGEANGQKPGATDTVVANYKGTLIDGTEFDNSYKRGQPATFPLQNVIKGWTEILQLMPKGAKWTVYIPGELAYGMNPRPGSGIKPMDVLVFDIELLDIKPTQTQTSTPNASN